MGRLDKIVMVSCNEILLIYLDREPFRIWSDEGRALDLMAQLLSDDRFITIQEFMRQGHSTLGR